MKQGRSHHSSGDKTHHILIVGIVAIVAIVSIFFIAQNSALVGMGGGVLQTQRESASAARSGESYFADYVLSAASPLTGKDLGLKKDISQAASVNCEAFGDQPGNPGFTGGISVSITGRSGTPQTISNICVDEITDKFLKRKVGSYAGGLIVPRCKGTSQPEGVVVTCPAGVQGSCGGGVLSCGEEPVVVETPSEPVAVTECTDTDKPEGGFSIDQYSVPGKATGVDGTELKDICATSTHLREAYCQANKQMPPAYVNSYNCGNLGQGNTCRVSGGGFAYCGDAAIAGGYGEDPIESPWVEMVS